MYESSNFRTVFGPNPSKRLLNFWWESEEGGGGGGCLKLFLSQKLAF